LRATPQIPTKNNIVEEKSTTDGEIKLTIEFLKYQTRIAARSNQPRNGMITKRKPK
jgi:hypothetical protein